MKKKLLVITSTFPRWKNDTVPPHVYELSKRLTADFDVTVLAPNYPGAQRNEIIDGMRIIRFKYFFEPLETLACSGGILPAVKKNKWYYFLVPFFIIAAYLALRKHVRENKPDIIHAHWTIPQGFLAALIKRRYKIPVVITAHGADIFALRKITPLKRFALKTADRITAASQSLKDEILAIDSSVNVNIISMGVDRQQFNPRKKNADIREKLGIQGPFLLFVGRLAEKKGVHHLIRAMQQVIRVHHTAKLVIVGSGFEEAALRKLTARLGLHKNILFSGALSHQDLPAYYASADLFISPSIKAKDGDREGMPVTIMEALSSGTPVIAGGIDNIEPGVIIVDPVEPRRLADSILTALRTPPRFKPGRTHDWQSKSQAYLKILHSISSKPAHKKEAGRSATR